MVDTNVFICFEKRGQAIDLSPWESSERMYVSVATVSELLMGVHRANTEERRQRRSAFVELRKYTMHTKRRRRRN